MVKIVRDFAATEGAGVVTVCAVSKKKLAELDDEEKAGEFLSELGIEQSGSDQLIQKLTRCLGWELTSQQAKKKSVPGHSD